VIRITHQTMEPVIMMQMNIDRRCQSCLCVRHLVVVCRALCSLLCTAGESVSGPGQPNVAAPGQPGKFLEMDPLRKNWSLYLRIYHTKCCLYLCVCVFSGYTHPHPRAPSRIHAGHCPPDLPPGRCHGCSHCGRPPWTYIHRGHAWSTTITTYCYTWR